MKRTLLSVVLSLSLCVGSGCAGFVPAVKHAVSGYEPTPEEKAATGYDTTVALTNVVIALLGWATRYAQEKITKKGEEKK